MRRVMPLLVIVLLIVGGIALVSGSPSASTTPRATNATLLPLVRTVDTGISPHATHTVDPAYLVPDADNPELRLLTQTPTNAYPLGMPAITPQPGAAPGTAAITADDVRAWVMTHPHPFVDLNAPAPTIASVRCMSALEAHTALGMPLVLPGKAPVCAVTLRGRFVTDGAPLPTGTQIIVSDTGHLLFDAHSGHLVTYGLDDDAS